LPAADDSDVTIRQIQPGDRLTGLKLGDGNTALKTFAQRHAHAYEKQSLARTYGVFTTEVGKLIAYVTLVCGEVVTDDDTASLVPDEGLQYLYNHYPAVKIARLAVDSRYRGHNLGRSLVQLALGQAKTFVCPTVGCRFVVVDSKADAVRFYEKCGFTQLDTLENRQRAEPVMFIDLNKAILD